MTATAAPPAAKFDVENPATGQIIASVDAVGPERIPELVARARAAQPGWEALGFAGRAQVLRRCQKWVIDNSDRIIETIVSETGKAWEDAQLAEVSYAAGSFGFWAKLGLLGSALAVFTLMLSDFFDTMGSAIGLGAEGGFLRPDGSLPRMNRVLLVDSLGAAVGGACSSSTATTYVEAAAGIAEGARTGLAAITTGVLFLLAMFLSPLAGVIPAEATAAAESVAPVQESSAR